MESRAGRRPIRQGAKDVGGPFRGGEELAPVPVAPRGLPNGICWRAAHDADSPILALFELSGHELRLGPSLCEAEDLASAREQH